MGAVLCLSAWCLTVGAQTGLSQSDPLPAFEVASVKPVPAAPGSRQPILRKCENGRLTMHNVSMMDLISWAFDRLPWDIVVPGWAAEAPGQPLYDIDAEAESPVPEPQVKLMLQRLLAERFQFAAHREMRVGVRRVLRVAKGGPQLKDAAPAVERTPKVRSDGANARIVCTGATIAEFLFFLARTGVGGPIYDRTGLTGRYDFTLDYRPYIQESDADHRLNALSAARIDAMRELGLEVVEVKMPVDTLVVDRAAKVPVGN